MAPDDLAELFSEGVVQQEVGGRDQDHHNVTHLYIPGIKLINNSIKNITVFLCITSTALLLQLTSNLKLVQLHSIITQWTN